MTKQLVIAIDGPAGAGKSTVARRVADALQYAYIDTGAMYRALTLAVLRADIDPAAAEGVAPLARRTDIEISPGPKGNRIWLDGEDVTDRLRDPRVSAAVSAVAAHGAVRDRMLQLQRQLGEKGGIVMDGRDIGTVVLPDADTKIFLTASVDARARRRWQQLRDAGHKVELQSIRHNIETRDALDSERDVAPLRQAADAIRIDTTHRTVDEVVDEVLRIARKGRA